MTNSKTILPFIFRCAALIAPAILSGCVLNEGEGTKEKLEISPDQVLNVPAEGKEVTLTVDSNLDVWAISTLPQWCSVSPWTGSKSEDITLTIRPHTDITQGRQGTMVVLGGTLRREIVISQDPLVVEADLYPMMHASFAAALKALEPSVDLNGDGKLSEAEALAITALDLKESNLTSLEGIHLLPNLETLICHNSTAPAIDLSGNKALTFVEIRNNYSLATVSVEGCSLLEHLDLSLTTVASLNLAGTDNLKTLVCFASRIPSLDLSGKTSLVTVEAMDNVYMKTLSVSGCTSLRTLRLSNGDLTEVNVSGLAQLTELSCELNRNLTSIVAGSNTALKTLRCDDCKISSLDATQFPALETLNVSQNTTLVTLNLQGLANLLTLDCSSTALSSVDISSTIALKDLNIGRTGIGTIDLTPHSNLETLAITQTEIVDLNVESNTLLTTLLCEHSHITSLDISRNRALTTVDCSECHDLHEIFIWWEPSNPNPPVTYFYYPEEVTLSQKQ